MLTNSPLNQYVLTIIRARLTSTMRSSVLMELTRDLFLVLQLV